MICVTSLSTSMQSVPFCSLGLEHFQSPLAAMGGRGGQKDRDEITRSQIESSILGRFYVYLWGTSPVPVGFYHHGDNSLHQSHRGGRSSSRGAQGVSPLHRVAVSRRQRNAVGIPAYGRAIGH